MGWCITSSGDGDVVMPALRGERRGLRPLLGAGAPRSLPLCHYGRTDPAIRLHRMTVEIRDSLLHLKRYSDSPDDLAATGGDPHSYARRVAAAIATKAAGHPPRASRFPPRHRIRPGTRDLTAELHQLLALAEAWPHVRGLAKSPES